MKKKLYVAPEMEEVKMGLYQSILAGSSTNGTGNPGGFDPDAPAPEDDY